MTTVPLSPRRRPRALRRRARPRAPWRRARRVAVAVLVASLGLTLLPAQAQEPDGGATDLEGASAADPLGALEQARAALPERLHDVPASSAALSAAEGRILSLEQTIVTNRGIRDDANLALLVLGEQRQEQRDRISAERARRRDAGLRAAQHREELATLAVEAYVGGGPNDDTFPLDAGATNDAGRQRIMVDAVDSTIRSRLTAAEEEIVDATGEVEAARVELDRVVVEIGVTTQRRDAAEAELARAEPALPGAQSDYRDAFMVATVTGSDMSVVAYDAYAGAAAGQPSCGLAWTVLAGIGRTESRHGTYGGARVLADGRTSPRIIGIALDGRPGIAAIADTDGGTLDGDATYDRAVGPMQFIPGTWRAFARDGNGDGRSDPHNVYDAAAAAAAYLCRLGGGLGDPGRLNRAILSYNQSQVYVDTVLGYRRGYDRLGLPG